MRKKESKKREKGIMQTCSSGLKMSSAPWTRKRTRTTTAMTRGARIWSLLWCSDGRYCSDFAHKWLAVATEEEQKDELQSEQQGNGPGKTTEE